MLENNTITDYVTFFVVGVAVVVAAAGPAIEIKRRMRVSIAPPVQPSTSCIFLRNQPK